MAGAFAERKPILLLLVLLTFNLILMSSYAPGAGRGSLLEDAVLGISSPFLKVAGWISQGTVGLWRAYIDLRGVERENARLRREVEALEPRSREADEAKMEVERLQRLLALRSEVPSPTTAARVIAVHGQGGSWTLLLDRGSRDGLRVNQPVITPRGVVGRIVEAAAGISKVQTILDPAGAAPSVATSRSTGTPHTRSVVPTTIDAPPSSSAARHEATSAALVPAVSPVERR